MNWVLKSLGFKPKLSEEAFQAYYNRLPEKVEVKWSREDNFIVGEINADGQTFMTQGADADDFIFMVNDAIIAYNEIPVDYHEAIKSAKAYTPPVEENKKLHNGSVKNSFLSLYRNKQRAHIETA